MDIVPDEKIKKLVSIYKSRYKLPDHDAWDCATIFYEKARWRDVPRTSRMIHYAFVDYLRKRYARIFPDESVSGSMEFKRALEAHGELSDDAMNEYMRAKSDSCGTSLEKQILVYNILKRYGSRKILAMKSGYSVRGKIIKRSTRPISVRRILFKVLAGWTHVEIADYCGLTESRISQIVMQETKRLGNLGIWN